MAVAFATLFSVAGWFVFKTMAWFRANVERRKAAEAKRDADHKAAEAKRDADHKAAEAKRADAEKRQAADMAELKAEVRGVKDAVGRLCDQREGDHKAVMEIKEEMARLEGRIEGLYRLHMEGTRELRADIAALGSRMDALERKVDGLDEKVDGIDRRLAVLGAEFAALKETVLPRARPAGAAPAGLDR